MSEVPRTNVGPCRACGAVTHVFREEQMCLPCGVVFENWLMTNDKYSPEMYDPEWTMVFDFNKPATRVAFDEWLEKGRP